MIRRVTVGGQLLQLRHETSALVEQLFRPVAPHPALQQLQMLRVLHHVQNRHLVRAPEVLRPCGRRPPSDPSSPSGVRSTIIGHSARSASLCVSPARLTLNRPDLLDAALHRLRHRRVHRLGSSPSTKYGFHPYPRNSSSSSSCGIRRQDRRIGDLVTVQVQHRQHRTIAHRIQKLV